MVEAPATVELNFALPPVAVAPIVIVSTDTAPEIVATLGASSSAEFKTANSVAPLVSDIAPAIVIASVLLIVDLPATKAIVVEVTAFLNTASPVKVIVAAETASEKVATVPVSTFTVERPYAVSYTHLTLPTNREV